MKFTRPRVIISACIESERCSHRGDIVECGTVHGLIDHADCTFLCPETGIGLPVPRSPLFLQKTSTGMRLVQSGTGTDYTGEIRSWAEKVLAEIDRPDGMILKFRSPSCGNNDVRIYPSSGSSNPLAIKSAGLFAEILLSRHTGLPVTTEAHLKNPFMRERYLTSLFASAGLRAMRHHMDRAALQEFHAHHKLLLMAWDEKSLRTLGPLAADAHIPIDEAIGRYCSLFMEALKKFPSTGSHVNVLEHVLGFFSKAISAERKKIFTGALDQYRRKKIPLSRCLELARSLIEEHDIEYLKEQVYFNPFPVELVLNSNSA